MLMKRTHQNWSLRPLVEVATLQRGYDLPIQNREHGNIPILAANNIVGMHNQSKISGPGVVTGRSGSIGNVQYVEGDYWPLNTSLYVKNFHGNHPRFIYYLLREMRLEQYHEGTGVPTLNRNNVHGIEVLVPPVEEQRRIAAILDQADALRAKRREALAQLDSLTQSIFIAMFGDPVSNPMSWTCRSLDEITSKVTDGEHLNPTFAESGMPIVMAGNLLVDQIDLNSAKRVETLLGQQFRKKCGPEFGDLLIVGRGATIGRLCRVNVHDTFCLMGSVILVKPNRLLLNEQYLSGMLAMPSMHSMLYNTSGSSAQQAIYLKDVKRLSCPLPPLPLQQTYATSIEVVEALKATHRAALDELDNLFTSLQHRAFRGEL